MTRLPLQYSRFTLPLVLVSFLFLTACASDTSSGQQTDAAPSSEELMDQFTTAWSQDDSTAVSEMFADDVVLISGSGVTSERDSVEAWRSGQMAGTDELTVQSVRSGTAGDLAYQTGRWSLTHAGGTATGSHTFLWKQQPDGTWRIAAMHIVDDPPSQRSGS